MSEVNPTPDIMKALNKQGVLISTAISFWRASSKLRPEDIGKQKSDIPDELISLGQKRLLPEQALADFRIIEGRVNAVIDKWTQTFMQKHRFATNEVLSTLIPLLEELKTEFDQAKMKFISNYSQHRKDSETMWREAAKKMKVDPDELIAEITKRFPDPDVIAAKFSFHIHMYAIWTPTVDIMTSVTDFQSQMEIEAARRAASEQAAKDIKDSATQFIADTVAQMRQEISEEFNDVLATINSSSKVVHQKTLNRVAEFIDRFKQLNWTGDKEMTKMLEGFRKEFLSKTADQYRNSDAAQAELKEALRKISQAAKDAVNEDVGQFVESFTNMGKRKIDPF